MIKNAFGRYTIRWIELEHLFHQMNFDVFNGTFDLKFNNITLRLFFSLQREINKTYFSLQAIHLIHG